MKQYRLGRCLEADVAWYPSSMTLFFSGGWRCAEGDGNNLRLDPDLLARKLSWHQEPLVPQKKSQELG